MRTSGETNAVIKPITRLYLLLAVLLLLVFSAYAWLLWEESLRDTEQELAFTNKLLTQATRSVLAQQESSLRLLGHRLLEAGALSRPEAGRGVIEQMRAMDPTMAGFGLAALDGQLILVSGVAPGQPLPNLRAREYSRPSFELALLRDAIVLGRPYFMAQLQRWVIPIRVAIRDDQRRPIAVMTAGYPITGEGTAWSGLDLPEGMRTYIVRKDGYAQYASHIDGDIEAFYSVPFEPALLARLSTSPTPLAQYSGKDNSAVFAHRVSIPEHDLEVVAVVERARSWAAWRGHLLIPAILLASFLLLGTLIYRHLGRLQAQHEARLIHLANHDALTGLPNQMLLLDRLDHAIESARYSGRDLALLFIDLDHFKNINDHYGHAFGDRLLRQVAERLGKALPPPATLGRQGGDEFIAILPGLDNPDTARHVAGELLQHLRQSFQIDARRCNVSGSIGIAMLEGAEDSGRELLRRADAAMYKAKAEGRGHYAFYSEELNARIRRRALIEEALRDGLARGEFSVAYQTQAECANGRVIGVEALVRWHSASLGPVSPAEFIPVAEEAALIGGIDDFVLRQACREIREIEAQTGQALALSVNLSATEVLNDQTPARISQACQEIGFPPHRLTLEVTETSLVTNFDHAAAYLQTLRDAGFGIALDDFGTGYSSISLLHRLPANEIKIDRAFVQDVLSDPFDAALVRGLVGMGRGLGVRVVAEGVETSEHYAFIRATGCDRAQGYHLSRPMPADALARLLAESLNSLKSNV
jgi:diguanylate cyclase (GGDEF)-like protein